MANFIRPAGQIETVAYQKGTIDTHNAMNRVDTWDVHTEGVTKLLKKLGLRNAKLTALAYTVPITGTYQVNFKGNCKVNSSVRQLSSGFGVALINVSAGDVITADDINLIYRV